MGLISRLAQYEGTDIEYLRYRGRLIEDNVRGNFEKRRIKHKIESMDPDMSAHFDERYARREFNRQEDHIIYSLRRIYQRHDLIDGVAELISPARTMDGAAAGLYFGDIIPFLGDRESIKRIREKAHNLHIEALKIQPSQDSHQEYRKLVEKHFEEDINGLPMQ